LQCAVLKQQLYGLLFGALACGCLQSDGLQPKMLVQLL
jgi:hypothetical protein